ncbi:hypothetical protein DPMN_167637 [Dreissena polymorpha]|uniref:Alpha-1,6-mannosyl-glycoprotein 2-beta-N-acetylglucosaminyltransferase n=2 Tax=Dreissena polymorpha TaxID=45954 RepID=A0A9D4IV77_DREPO|nr:hypothetical protein DPMN_167637 [Dreissena polymorpha]
MRRVLRWLLMVVLLTFVILNLHVLVNFEPDFSGSPYHEIGNHGAVEHKHIQSRDSVKTSLDIKSEENDTSQFIIKPNTFRNRTENYHMLNNSQNLTEIYEEILRINSEQKIRNLYRYGLKLDQESVVMVIQVHDRLEYLRILIESLREVRGIEKTLLIISHDVYSDGLNQLVKEVDFCPVLQIFFPHSLQLHPDSFPGEDPNDCPRDIKKGEAVKKKCKNAAFPDKYGHYREAKYCQTKHHWLWKLHHVYDNVSVMRGYKGLILLLEEDYYVTPDIIPVLQMMQNLRKKDCKDCKILAAGNYDKNQNFGTNAGQVEVANWISSRHNMGMAFNSDLWEEIKRCAKEFCNFDDYNWDWTLQHLSSQCIPNQMKVLKMKATRVFHMGECGVHHKGKNCKPEEKKKEMDKLVTDNKKHLFPNTVSIGSYSGLRLRDPKPNGGWGDLRDQNLCLSFIINTTATVGT